MVTPYLREYLLEIHQSMSLRLRIFNGQSHSTPPGTWEHDQRLPYMSCYCGEKKPFLSFSPSFSPLLPPSLLLSSHLLFHFGFCILPYTQFDRADRLASLTAADVPEYQSFSASNFRVPQKLKEHPQSPTCTRSRELRRTVSKGRVNNIPLLPR